MEKVKVQKLYEMALSILGKSEEGTDYPFMDRVPSLLNVYIAELNLFRDDKAQIAMTKAIQDTIDISDKEMIALSYCLACIAASEITVPDIQIKILFDTRNRLMGSFTTGLTAISETIGVK